MNDVRERIKDITLISDVDGVAMDWTQGFVNYMASIGHHALHANPSTFGMTDIFPELEKPWTHIMDYQHSPFYEQVRAYEDAKETYGRLHDLGAKIVFLSSCGETDFIKTTRENTLNSEFSGKFDDIILLPFGASKLDALSKFKKGSVFIDDQVHIAQEGVLMGHNSFLRDMPYNSKDSCGQVVRLTEMNQLTEFYRKTITPQSIRQEKNSEFTY